MNQKAQDQLRLYIEQQKAQMDENVQRQIAAMRERSERAQARALTSMSREAMRDIEQRAETMLLESTRQLKAKLDDLLTRL